jgi:hypothetical protein
MNAACCSSSTKIILPRDHLVTEKRVFGFRRNPRVFGSHWMRYGILGELTSSGKSHRKAKHQNANKINNPRKTTILGILFAWHKGPWSSPSASGERSGWSLKGALETQVLPCGRIPQSRHSATSKRNSATLLFPHKMEHRSLTKWKPKRNTHLSFGVPSKGRNVLLLRLRRAVRQVVKVAVHGGAGPLPLSTLSHHLCLRVLPLALLRLYTLVVRQIHCLHVTLP